MPTEAYSQNLATNLRQLRETRGLSQQILSKLSGVPRPTLAQLESGSANPTISLLLKVSAALQVSVEELISAPRGTGRIYRASTLATKKRGEVEIRKLIPEPVTGIEFDRFRLPAGARMQGIPHRTGTREYLVCETGNIEVVVGGESYRVGPGDVLAFRGDQKHSYINVSATSAASGTSLVVIAASSSD